MWTVTERLQSGQLAICLFLSMFNLSSTTTTGSGPTGSADSAGSFVILILGFAFAFAWDFAFTGFTSSSTTASWTGS